MGRREHKSGSSSMLTPLQEIILFRVKSAATSVEMETVYAGSALPVGRNKIKKVTLGFMVSLRWAIIFSHSGTYSIDIQASAARSAQGIFSDVKSQVEQACLGVAQHVQNQQTASGIKDAHTQSWIDELIDRARTLRKRYPERTSADIQAELLTWVNEHQSEIYNPFLTLDGEYLIDGKACTV